MYHGSVNGNAKPNTLPMQISDWLGGMPNLLKPLLSLLGGSLSILPNASALLLDRMCVHRQVVFTADGLLMRSLVPTRANPGAQAGRGTKSPVTWTLVG